MQRDLSKERFGGSVTIGKTIVLGLVSALEPTVAFAQTRISPEDFLSAVEGKTADFHEIHTGALVGIEQFLSSKLSVWWQPGLGCVYGQISVSNGQICFQYDDIGEGVYVCWWPFEHEGRLMVRESSFAFAEIQEIRRISNDNLDCPNAPIS